MINTSSENKPIMMISMPYTGSSWIYSGYMVEYNKKFDVMPLHTPKGSNEFFRDDNTEFLLHDGSSVNLNSIDEKINFLENERKHEREYSIRVKFNSIYDQTNRNYTYCDWFKNFYSDKFTIVKLDRHNRWDQLANELYEFHEHPVIVSDGFLKDRVLYIDGYENFHLDNVEYYEELTEKNLSKFFGLPEQIYNDGTINGVEYKKILREERTLHYNSIKNTEDVKYTFEYYLANRNLLPQTKSYSLFASLRNLWSKRKRK